MVQRAEAENFDFNDAGPQPQQSWVSQPPWRLLGGGGSPAGTGSRSAQSPSDSGDTDRKEKGLYKR